MHSLKARKCVSFILILGLIFSTGAFAPAFNVPVYAELDDTGGMNIVSAEVGTPGAIVQLAKSSVIPQATPADLYKYRKAMYPEQPAEDFLVGQGDMTLDDNDTPDDTSDDMYYTKFRNASLSESRTFNVEATFADDFGDVFDPANLDWWYGDGTTAGKSELNMRLGDWTAEAYNCSSGGFASGYDDTTKLATAGAIEFIDNGDTITVSAKVKFDAFMTSNRSVMNGSDFLNDMEDATLRLHYAGRSDALASMPFRILYRDYISTWEDLDEYITEEAGPGADDFIEADGTANPTDGSYGDPDRYIRVESLTKTSGFNLSGTVKTNFEEPNDMWVGIVADSKGSYDRYLNEIEPMLTTDPASVESTFGEDLRLSVVYTNIHSNEHHGPDAILELFKLFAEGDQMEYERALELDHQLRSTSMRGTDTETINMDIDEELLDKYIFIFLFVQNPDSRVYNIRAVNYGFDPNRDGSYHQTPEGRAAKAFLAKWDPVSCIELHNSYNPIQIDPCTAPHDPNSEYDLLTPMLHQQATEIGRALTGTTVFKSYQIPDQHYDGGTGFDDASPVYSPNFTMHYGALGATIESQSEAAQDTIGSMIGLMGATYNLSDNFDEFVDFKTEYKLRGVENRNTDAEVNKYLFSVSPNTGQDWIPAMPGAVRDGKPMIPRPYSETGGSYFPQYYAIPMDSANQLDVSQAYAMLEYFTRTQVRVEKLTKAVTVGDKTYEAGTLIVDLRQGNRDIANTVLCEGVDVSTTPDRLYAEVTQNFPALRGFSCDRIEAAGVFDGKTAGVNYKETEFGKKIIDAKDLTKPAALLTGSDSTVIVKNNTLDAIKVVIKALQDGKAVNMITADTSTGDRGDFVMTKDVFDSVKDGFYVEAATAASVSEGDYTPLVRPVIRVNGNMTESARTFDLMGFNLDQDGGANPDISYTDTLQGRNVIINLNNGTDVSADVASGIGFINVGANSQGFAGESMKGADDTTDFAAGSINVGGSREALVKGEFADNSIITANMDLAKYMFSNWGNQNLITAIPESAVALAVSSDDSHMPADQAYKNLYYPGSFFTSGWAYDATDSGTQKRAFANKIFAAAGTYEGKDDGAPIITFATNIFVRAHNEFFAQRMLGNAVLVAAAGINPNVPSTGVPEPDPDIDAMTEKLEAAVYKASGADANSAAGAKLKAEERVAELLAESGVTATVADSTGGTVFTAATVVDSPVQPNVDGEYKFTVTLGDGGAETRTTKELTLVITPVLEDCLLSESIHYLVNTIGPRPAGTIAEYRAHEYMVQKFNEIDAGDNVYDIELEEYLFNWVPEKGLPTDDSGRHGHLFYGDHVQFGVIEADIPSGGIFGNPYPNNETFRDFEVGSELFHDFGEFDADTGTVTSIPSETDVQNAGGKVYGTLRFDSAVTSEMINNAVNNIKASYGSSVEVMGLIVARTDSVRTRPADPLGFTYNDVPATVGTPADLQVSVTGLSLTDLENTKDAGEAGKITGFYRSDPKKGWVSYARKPAADPDNPDLVMVLMSHIDTVKSAPGAQDTATGVTMVLELAKRFKDVPTGNVELIFAAGGGEEYDDFSASTHLIEKLRAEGKDAITINYMVDTPASEEDSLNVLGNPTDTFAMGTLQFQEQYQYPNYRNAYYGDDLGTETSVFNLSSHLLTSFADEVDRSAGIKNVKIMNWGASDHAMWAYFGIDACRPTGAAQNGDFSIGSRNIDIYGWKYHSALENLDNYNYERHLKHCNLLANAIQKAVDLELSKRAEFSVDGDSVTLTNAEQLFKAYDGIKGTFASETGDIPFEFTPDATTVTLADAQSYEIADVIAFGEGISDNNNPARNNIFTTTMDCIIVTDGSVIVDKATLTSDIATADELLADTATSTDGTDISANAYWATEAAKNTFTAAITAAEAVLNNAAATQAEVDDAVSALAAAYTAFESARAAGTGRTGGGGGSGGGGITITPTPTPTAEEPTGNTTQISNPFNDVAESGWYYDAVMFVYQNNIMQGTGAGFAPTTTLNRAMLVQMLYNLEGKPAGASSGFNDVSGSDWYAAAVGWASGNDVVSGMPGNMFAPGQSITREQMAVMLYNYCVYKGITLPTVNTGGSFADSGEISAWASDAVNAMYAAGILNGKGANMFDPKGTATRAEVAQMFMNFMEAME